jgi:hypothetical protein
MSCHHSSRKCCSSRRCHVVYVDPEYGNDCTGKLQSAKCVFKTYAAAINAILSSDKQPSEFDRWLVKLGNCTFNEPLNLYSWIDIEGESRQGTLINNQIIAADNLSLNSEVYIANLTVHPQNTSAVVFNMDGAVLMQNVRLLRLLGNSVAKNKKEKLIGENYLVELSKGSLNLINSIVTLESGNASKVAIYNITGEDIVNLVSRNNRHTLTFTGDNTESLIRAFINSNTNSATSILSKANTYESVLPTPVTNYSHLLSDSSKGKLASHHDSIRFTIPQQPYSVYLYNIGPSFVMPPKTTNFTAYLTTQNNINNIIASVNLINSFTKGDITVLVSPVPITSSLQVVIQWSDGITTEYSGVAAQDVLNWSGKIDSSPIDTVLRAIFSPPTNNFTLVHTVNSGTTEMIDADIRNLPTNYRITYADGANATSIAHNHRIHDKTVLPPALSVNGGKSLQTSLVTDGMKLIGGQEASQIKKLTDNNLNYEVEPNVTAVVAKGQGNIINLPAITPSFNEDRTGVKLILKNASTGAVGVTTADGSNIDTKPAYSIRPFGALTVLASSNPNEWHIVSQSGVAELGPYPFDYKGLGYTNIQYLQFTSPTSFNVPTTHSIVAFTLTGGGGGSFSNNGSVQWGGGAGGGGASLQVAFDSAKLLANGFTKINIVQIGVGGINTTAGATPGTPSIISLTNGRITLTFEAYAGAEGGISTLGFTNGGGGGAGLGGNGQAGSQGGAGGPPQNGLGVGGNGGFNRIISTPVAATGATQSIIPTSLFVVDVFYNQSTPILFTPGSGGGVYFPKDPYGKHAHGGPLMLIDGTASSQAGFSGGYSLGSYPVGPLGTGATIIEGVLTVAQNGGGGVYIPGVGSANGGGGFVGAQIVPLP